MSRYVVNQRWRPLSGRSYEITYISARTHDSYSHIFEVQQLSGTSPNIARRKRKSEIQDGHQFGEFVDLTDVITPAKINSKIVIGFSRPRVGKSIFPSESKRPI